MSPPCGGRSAAVATCSSSMISYGSGVMVMPFDAVTCQTRRPSKYAVTDRPGTKRNP